MHFRVLSLMFVSSFLSLATEATTFLVAHEQQLSQQADTIVVGEVAAVTPQYDRASRTVSTVVRLRISEVLKGEALPSLDLVEWGGNTEEIAAQFFGVPVYWPGEKVVVFASRRPDGTWATTSLALGKYTIVEGGRRSIALRDLGPGTLALEWDGRALRPTETRAAYDWSAFRRSILDAVSGRSAPRAMPLKLDATDPEETKALYVAPFALMSSPGRWFEADRGEPVGYFVDPSGDATIGPEETRAAIDAAMAAWSMPPIATLRLQRAGEAAPGKLDCSGPTQIMFNDPQEVLSDPWFCSGILAVGGFCAEKSSTTTVNGVTFPRITTAKILFNNGWGQCPFWNTCNVAEVVTHELGHTIGFGHSGDSRATMFAYAHFDGRCAALRADDLAALSFVYPASANLHDVVVVPPARARARIRRGKPEVYLPLTLTVRHADTWGDRARFRLVSNDGTCPVGTVGAANFGMFPDAPAEVELAPGAQAKATVWLNVRATAFSTSDPGDPVRCELQFRAEALAQDNIDPVPGNESVVVSLDVIDENDVAGRQALPRLVLEQTKPVSLRLPRGKQEIAKSVGLKIRTGSLADTVSVMVDPGDCPSGLVQPAQAPRVQRVFIGVAMASNQKATAHVPLVFNANSVSSVFPGSPTRCTARVQVSGENTDTNLGNNSLPLVIDLRDDNDL